MSKEHDPTWEELADAYLDVLEGNSRWHEIQYFTGLDEFECRKLSEMYEKTRKARE